MTKTFTKGSLSLKFSTTPTPKLSSVFMYIHIDTKQNDLLESLSIKYVKEKTLKLGSNANNNIYNATPGQNGIVINCPENKITNNILQYLIYLSKATIKPTQFYAKSGTKTNYSSFIKDLHNISINIIGKCKTFTKNCISVPSTVPKMQKLLDAISTVFSKNNDREDIEAKGCEECKVISIKASPCATVDALVLLNNSCCIKTTSSGFDIICCCGCCGYSNYMDTYRAQLKAFRGQFGAIGSKGDAKAKAKCRYVNEMAKIFTGVKGVEKSLKDNEIVKVDVESIKVVKDALKQIKKECK